jgi:hypothetical protein
VSLRRRESNDDFTNEIITGKPGIGNRMGVWQGVAMDSLKFHQGLPCPTFYALRAGHPYNRFRGGLPTGRVAHATRRTPMKPEPMKRSSLFQGSLEAEGHSFWDKRKLRYGILEIYGPRLFLKSKQTCWTNLLTVPIVVDHLHCSMFMLYISIGNAVVFFSWRLSIRSE